MQRSVNRPSESTGLPDAVMAPAAAALIGIGLAYQRAVITVLDPAGLEQAACECYHMFKEQFERFPGKSIA